MYDAPAPTRTVTAPSARVEPRAATTPAGVFTVTTSPESGRGAHSGSGGLRSTGHTGLAVTLTVMGTRAPACAATAQLSTLAEQTAKQTQRRPSEALTRPIVDGECHENVIQNHDPLFAFSALPSHTCALPSA